MVAERTPRRGKLCGVCGLRVVRPITRAAAPAHTHSAGLQVAADVALPTDIRISALFQPDAPTGHLVVTVGMGQGSKGKGTRIGDDPAVHVAVIRRLACHLQQYARDFEAEAAAEEPRWLERLTAAAALLNPAPRTLLQPCVHCGAPSLWESCLTCVPS